MVMYPCCGDGFVGNAHPNDMTVYAIALLDWGLLAQFAITRSRLCDLQREEHSIEVELQQLLTDPKFTAYRKVFKSFGFGVRLEAVIRAPSLSARSLFRC